MFTKYRFDGGKAKECTYFNILHGIGISMVEKDCYFYQDDKVAFRRYTYFNNSDKELLSATQNAKSGNPRDKPKLSGINQHKADCYAVCCVSQVVYPARCSKVSCQKNRCKNAPIFYIC